MSLQAQYFQHATPGAPNVHPGLRSRAGEFWLAIFFQLTRIAPGLVRFFRPAFIRLAFAFSRKIRRNARLNALRLGVEPDQHASFGLAVVGSFYDFVYDIGKSMGATREQLARRVTAIDGAENYLAARAGKRGAILLTAHMGSFEAGLAALPVHENKVHVVFKPDRVASFERLRQSLREQLNVIEAPIDHGLVGWMRLREALQRDEVVAVQGDRVMPGQKGHAVPMLGGTILLPTGPFKLAIAAQAPVIPIFSVRQNDGTQRIVIHPAIEVEPDHLHAALEAFAGLLAVQLKAHPSQWLILDPAFCEDSRRSDL
jgi:KDO2-lipid IV(A) lauroyltransferase